MQVKFKIVGASESANGQQVQHGFPIGSMSCIRIEVASQKPWLNFIDISYCVLFNKNDNIKEWSIKPLSVS